MYRILFIDDDIELLEATKEYFADYDYQIDYATNAKRAIKLAESTAYQCIVLDLKLPDHDGFDVLTTIRKYTNTPVIVLSNYSEYNKRIEGLQLGADDYVCKPFSFEELRLRIELRVHAHFEERPPQIYKFGDLVIDTGTHIVSYRDNSVLFSLIEMEILKFLVTQPGRVFSYEQIYDAVWKEPLNSGKHTLQARVAEVRIRLNSLCPDHPFIETVRGKGYCFKLKQ